MPERKDPSPLTPRGELVLAWAVEVTLDGSDARRQQEVLLRVAADDRSAVSAARRLAQGLLTTDDHREQEVDELLFGSDAGLTDAAEIRDRVAALLCELETLLGSG